jgi:hypothetical protein
MLFGNAMECALLKVGLIDHKRKPRTPKIHTFLAINVKEL